MMLPPAQTVKQELLQKIDYLPDYELQEVLNFVEFLLFKSETTQKHTSITTVSQPEILKGLTHIREKAQQAYGVHQGDLVAEVREERGQQLDSTLGLDVLDESSY